MASYSKQELKLLRLQRWHNHRMNRLSYKARKREYKLQQKEVNRKFRFKLNFDKPTTTKIVVIFLFLNFSIVEIYSMWVMAYIRDLSALYTLITSVIGETIAFAVYCAKSYNETKQEELNKLEYRRLETQQEYSNENTTQNVNAVG